MPVLILQCIKNGESSWVVEIEEEKAAPRKEQEIYGLGIAAQGGRSIPQQCWLQAELCRLCKGERVNENGRENST